ncbi:type VII secretion system-associated protein [Actinoplanes sp. NPDC026670]|uniref:type VII secretion system-associated protein n=1 Tax=Actinoplanes sp. NPDC026670 TaxID=3154700 RepID=UPI0033EBE4FF
MTDRYLLLDPAWTPGPDDGSPPASAVAGSWPVAADGRIAGFRPNPAYRPIDPDAPADPLDALLRGTPPVELVQLLLRDAVFDVACDEQGRPLVVYAPDHTLCLIVATSAPQRDIVPVAGWQRTDLLGLIGQLDDGVDVLANPYGPAPARITGDDVRAAHLLDDGALAAARARLRLLLPPHGTELPSWAGGPSVPDPAVGPSPAGSTRTAVDVRPSGQI